MKPYTLTRILPLSLVVCMAAVLLVGQEADLGYTDFPTSGSPEAQKPFLRGLLLLHSFEYEDARKAFRQARELDPDFAMAYWGEAMTRNHPIWNQQEPQKARAALNRLAPTLEGRLAKAPTEREKDYLRTLEVLYGEGDKVSRDVAYADAMRRLTDKYPDDLDAASFYALALLGTRQAKRDFAVYMRAAAVVEEVFAKNPHHPGAAHYLIHSYDDPIHAPLGLRAARVYARIAPAAPHALHMPSHIFVALGMWDDVSASNEASWAAAHDQGRRNYHALLWLEYSYLQQGRYRDARKQLAIMEDDARRQSGERTDYHLAHMRAHYLIETGEWDAASIQVDLSSLELVEAVTSLFTDGLAALKRDDRGALERALDAIKQRLQSQDDETDRDAAEIMAKELEAMFLLSEGKSHKAVQIMRDATAQEDGMQFDYGPPVPVKPSHELLGEMLLKLERPEEAREEFQLALLRAPKRALSLLGLVRAAGRSGDLTVATQSHDELRRIWHKADRPVPELELLMKGGGRTQSGRR